MASPGDNLRNVWTADFYNQIRSFMGLASGSNNVTTSGPLSVAKGPGGLQIVAPQPRQACSTLQGYVVGGSTQPTLSDGTETIEPYAWQAYSIQAAYFKLSAGTCTLTVKINGTAVSWLNALSITTTASVINIASPSPNLTHVVPVGGKVDIVIASSSGASGLLWSLNVPF